MNVSRRWCVLALTTAFALSAVGAPMAFAEESTESPSSDRAPQNILRSTQDYPVDFNFNFYGATQGTNPEWKENDSSSYLFVSSGKTIDWCYVFIDGSNSSDIGTFVNRTVNRSTGGSGGSCTVSYPGEFQIWNRVKEDGNLGWARLTGRAEGPTGRLPGLWSADSWGSYPIINNW